MPRPPRKVAADAYYHVLNRGNGRMDIFHKPADFEAFIKVLAEGLARYPVDLLAYCLMNNHWHLVLRPRGASALGDLMRWVGVTHVRRHHERYASRGGGHLYQGRFKSFPIQDDEHFRIVCRYVEANPLRAGMVKRAEEWPWSSLGRDPAAKTVLPLAKWPVERPRNWVGLVNRDLAKVAIESLRVSVNRGRPFGEETWVAKTAKRLKLGNTLRERGRPRKKPLKGDG